MFEIRLAVIGYVSVGKTTVINALFGDEFGEVAMKRTTAVVNSFRLSSSAGNNVIMTDSSKEENEDESIEFVADRLSASATLQETTVDNANFRNSEDVKERSFEISLDKPLHKMRPDTKLVIVDVPGINEAGTSSKYKDYVNCNWHSFDVVVLVMDARQGVNTEEQYNLLKLAKENLLNTKQVPLIVLNNKVDDPENEEQRSLLCEARRAVEELFGVSDREKALEATLKSLVKTNKKSLRTQFFPSVVPISAMHAFVYRCGSRLTFEDFCKMDSDFIDKIGKDSYGRQWRRYDKKKQLEMAFKAVSEEEQRQDGLEASNFEVFTQVLAVCIGDEANQTKLLQKQVDVALDRMKSQSQGCDFGAEILVASKTLAALGNTTCDLHHNFWLAYKRLKTEAFKDLRDNFSVLAFAAPISQLVNYAVALKSLRWAGETEAVVKAAETLVLGYGINVVQAKDLKAKSGADQEMILRSMLLPMNDPLFYSRFGFLKMHLESLVAARKINANSDCCPTCRVALEKNCTGTGRYHYCVNCDRNYVDAAAQGVFSCRCSRGSSRGSGKGGALSVVKDACGKKHLSCPRCQQNYYILRHLHSTADFEMKVKDGALVPVDADDYNQTITVLVPASLDNPAHVGHLFWKCCELLKEVSS